MKKTTTTLTAKVVSDGMVAVESEPDIWIADESIVPMLKMLEVFGAGDPNNKAFSGLMARIYGNINFGFFELKQMEAKKEDRAEWHARIERYYKLGYEKGMEYLRRRFGSKVDGNIREFEKAVSKSGKRDLMPLFWTAFNLGNIVNLNRDDIASVANIPKINAMLDAIIAVDPSFGNGSVLAFKGAMLASRPAMLGGNPEKAKDLFSEADKVSGGKFLMNKVMYAEWYAVPRGENDLAKTVLNEVVSAPPEFPEQALANALAKKRARLLLKNL